MQTTENEFEVAETILQQLKQSRVNRFPFFAYTGIKKVWKSQDGELLLREVPRNPGRIDSVSIKYNFGDDLYTVKTIRKGEVLETIEGVFFDQMAHIIAQRMGVL